MKTINEFSDLIYEIERKYDTAQIQYEGFHYWPLVRKTLLDVFYSTTREKVVTKNSQRKKFMKLSRYFMKILKFPLESLKVSLSNNSKYQIDVLFTGDSSEHLTVQGESINRFLYPFIRNNEECKVRDTYFNTRDMVLLIGSIRVDVKSLILIEILRFRHLRPISISAPVQELLLLIIEDVCSRAKLSKELVSNLLTNNLNSTMASYRVFERILNILKPKKVLSVCYYGPEVYGLFQASKEKNIPTVDIQHGAQGSMHLAYANFTKVPKEGYGLLPKYFWVWDKASQDNLEEWTSKQSFHKIVMGGQPWLSSIYIKQKEQHRDSDKICIIYSMQFPTLSEFEINLMRSTSKEFHWYLKPHPTWDGKITQVQDKINKNTLTNFVTILSAETALIDWLISADIHVSKFSGSVIESALLGTYSVIIDTVGTEAFSELIEAGKAFGYTNADQGPFDQFLKTILDKPPLPKSVLDLDEVINLYNSIQ